MKIYFHYLRMFIRLKFRSSLFSNKRVDNREWLMLEEWYIVLGFKPLVNFVHEGGWKTLFYPTSWFDYDDMYYDGHTQRCITLFGLNVGYGYSYQSKRKDEWTREELEEW